jgi:protein-disulfide isomerase
MKSRQISIFLVIIFVASAAYLYYKSAKKNTATVVVDVSKSTQDNGANEENDSISTSEKSDKDPVSVDSSITENIDVIDTSGAAITKDEVVHIIRNEIKENPEIVVDAFQEHINKHEQKEKEKIDQSILENKDALLNNKYDPKYGVRSAKNTIISYYDYNCSYCKKMSNVIKKLIADKQNVYIVFKELPILGAMSVQASKAALAINEIAPNKYLEFHFRLMEDSNTNDMDQKIKNIARSLGVDETKLYETMETKKIEDILRSNLKLASNIGIRGTPAIIIDNQLFPGAITYAQLLQVMSESTTATSNNSVVSTTEPQVTPPFLAGNSAADDESENATAAASQKDGKENPRDEAINGNAQTAIN